VNDTIQKLVEAWGPSGQEDAVRELIRAEIAGLADEVQVDPLGNLIARRGPRGPRGGRGRESVRREGARREGGEREGGEREGGEGGGRENGARRIMLAAHMDEIGLMVTHVDEKGFLRFTSVGYLIPITLLGGRVRFGDGTVGVIGIERRDRDGDKAPSLEQLYIDVGATSQADCPIRVGDQGAMLRPYTELAGGGRLVAKSMDDRIGCAVLIETLRRLKRSPHELAFVFTVQEEVGTRGAQTSAYGLDPEIGIAVDVTTTGDTPEARRMAVRLGGGPAIKVRDVGMLAHPGVKNWMVACAEENDILYQLEVLEGGSTDARAIQLSRGGVAAGCLSIPCRYVHTPSEMVDAGDVEGAVRLLVAMLSAPVAL
jgi:endoglucanase